MRLAIVVDDNRGGTLAAALSVRVEVIESAAALVGATPEGAVVRRLVRRLETGRATPEAPVSLACPSLGGAAIRPRAMASGVLAWTPMK